MASNTYLEDMPPLVLEKITSFLNHKHLLALEQVSKKLKRAVGAHFSITDHLIVGPLPSLREQSEPNKTHEVIARDIERFEGLLKVLERCGTALRTIQIQVTGQHLGYPISKCVLYLKYLFKSAELAYKCPNIEHIITSPKIYEEQLLFNQQNVAVVQSRTDIYASNVKLFTGKTCKLRSISLQFKKRVHDQYFERMLFLYSNIEQIIVHLDHGDFLKYLPQFIENGLKDLKVATPINIQNAKKFCSIGTNLRTLILSVLVDTNDDVAFLNNQLPRNTKLKIVQARFDIIDLMSEDVRNSIIKFDAVAYDFSLLAKLKNLQALEIIDLVRPPSLVVRLTN